MTLYIAQLYVTKFSTIFLHLTKLYVTQSFAILQRHQSHTVKSAKTFLTVYVVHVYYTKRGRIFSHSHTLQQDSDRVQGYRVTKNSDQSILHLLICIHVYDNLLQIHYPVLTEIFWLSYTCFSLMYLTYNCRLQNTVEKAKVVILYCCYRGTEFINFLVALKQLCTRTTLKNM